MGVAAHRGDLTDTDSLAAGARECEGVIHTAFIHDFSAYAAAAETDRRAIERVGGQQPWITALEHGGDLGRELRMRAHDIPRGEPRRITVDRLDVVGAGAHPAAERSSSEQ